MEIWGKNEEIEFLPTRECEAGYGPGWYVHFSSDDPEGISSCYTKLVAGLNE